MEKPQLRKVNLSLVRSWDPRSRLSPSHPSSSENEKSCPGFLHHLHLERELPSPSRLPGTVLVGRGQARVLL